MCVSCLYLCTFVPETFLGKSISSVIWLSRSIDWLTHKPLHPFFRHTHFYACRNRTTNENDSLIVLLCVYVNKWVFTLRILLTSVSRKKWTRNRLIFDSMYQLSGSLEIVAADWFTSIFIWPKCNVRNWCMPLVGFFCSHRKKSVKSVSRKSFQAIFPKWWTWRNFDYTHRLINRLVNKLLIQIMSINTTHTQTRWCSIIYLEMWS